MTGTVWDPVITGKSMRLHNQLHRFGNTKSVVCVDAPVMDYNYTTHALVFGESE